GFSAEVSSYTNPNHTVADYSFQFFHQIFLWVSSAPQFFLCFTIFIKFSCISRTTILLLVSSTAYFSVTDLVSSFLYVFYFRFLEDLNGISILITGISSRFS
ncbi:hypothetical protein ACH5RR_040462, partial [Cinchona calisaya]